MYFGRHWTRRPGTTQYETTPRKHLQSRPSYWGCEEKAQIRSLRAGCGLVITTPGRLQDFITPKSANCDHVKLLVLDEADRMLDRGFLPALRLILTNLPPQSQDALLFSATMEQSVAWLVHDHTREPVRIALGSTLKPAELVQLKAYEVCPSQKLDAIGSCLTKKTGGLWFSRAPSGVLSGLLVN